MEFIYCYSSSKAPNGSISKLVRWEKPLSGWTKLNTDGVSLGNPRVAGFGGVVRDKRGNWVAAFARKIGLLAASRQSYGGYGMGLLCAAT